MPATFFTLPNCKTCQRIDADLDPAGHGAVICDIKAEGISAEQLDAMQKCRQLCGIV